MYAITDVVIISKIRCLIYRKKVAFIIPSRSFADTVLVNLELRILPMLVPIG
jgi:hypothetical protein